MTLTLCPCMKAYCLYQNDRGFNDYDRVPSLDAGFATAEEAVAYVHKICWGESTGKITFTFDIVDESKTVLKAKS